MEQTRTKHRTKPKKKKHDLSFYNLHAVGIEKLKALKTNTKTTTTNKKGFSYNLQKKEEKESIMTGVLTKEKEEEGGPTNPDGWDLLNKEEDFWKELETTPVKAVTTMIKSTEVNQETLLSSLSYSRG